MISLKQYLSELRYFIRSFEQYASVLLFLAIIIGLVDAAGISLLYPMLSVGFQIPESSLPMSGIYSFLEKIIPIGSPFIHLGILFIILTGLSLLLQLIYWKIAFIFKREIVIKIKKQLFEKIETSDYQYFTNTKQGDILNLFNQSPFYVEQTYDRIISFGADFVSAFVTLCMLFIISPIGILLVSIGGGKE